MNRRRFQQIERMFHFYYGRFKTETIVERTVYEVLTENFPKTSVEELRRFAIQLNENGYKLQSEKIISELDEILGQSSFNFDSEESLPWL